MGLAISITVADAAQQRAKRDEAPPPAPQFKVDEYYVVPTIDSGFGAATDSDGNFYKVIF